MQSLGSGALAGLACQGSDRDHRKEEGGEEKRA
eukprot:CAMPEP_0115669310 /NCGR_PEP_ID=MMETSP0272-20121206/50931_1 /TAXON_ID=71861 /ORGANISM="Scrippsiella trochoidea, Strain CCMP3099" /LENGTH=32 /DNA_ID= /DNA_START= /DNA_END= /DNA_ORIENTATION=